MTPPPLHFTIPPDIPRVRLDQWLARQLEGPSRSEIQTWIREGLVKVNGEQVAPGIRLSGGMQIHVTPPATEELSAPSAQDLPLEVVYEDPALVVINKPPAWVVHPAPGHPDGTVLNAMLHHFPDLADAGPAERPGLVHRLDADTSGLLLFARTSGDLEHLQNQFRNRETEKRYECVCRGIPHPVAQDIDLPIGRHPVHRKRRAVNGLGAKPAKTHLQMLRGLAEGQAAHLSISIETGRTHQIRVHLDEIGHPVLGDPIYGGRQTQLPGSWEAPPRLLLHARHLGITHPRSGQPIAFDAPLPDDFTSYLEHLS